MAFQAFDTFLAQSLEGASVLKEWWKQSNQQIADDDNDQPTQLGNSQLSASRIYGSQSFGPVLTQWQPLVASQLSSSASQSKPTVSQEKIRQVEKILFQNYFSIKELSILTQVSHEYQNHFWRFLFVKVLLNAPQFDNNKLPPMDYPYIPLDYSEKQIKADRLQKMPTLALGIANRLLHIKPQDMGSNTFMQGRFEIKTDNEKEVIIHYYLMRCMIEHPGTPPKESVITIFKCPSGIFVIDSTNSAIESYHPQSPIRFKYISDLLKDLVMKKKGCHGCEVKPNGDETIGAALKPCRIILWKSPPKRIESPYMRQLLSISAAANANQISYRHDLIIIRTTLVAFSTFMLLKLAFWNVNESYLLMLAFVLCSSFSIAEHNRATTNLNQRSLELFYENQFPPSSAMKRIASSAALINELGIRLQHDTYKMNRTSQERRTLLSYCEHKDFRALLMRFGASPLIPTHQRYPLLEAVENNDLPRIHEFLSHRPHFVLNESQEMQIAEAASIPVLEMVLKFRPKFNLNAKMERDELELTALQALFRKACNHPVNTGEELARAKWLFNKCTHLIKCGSNPSQLLVSIRAMEKLREFKYVTQSEQLTKMIGPHSAIAWKNAYAFQDILTKLKTMATAYIKQTSSPE